MPILLTYVNVFKNNEKNDPVPYYSYLLIILITIVGNIMQFIILYVVQNIYFIGTAFPIIIHSDDMSLMFFVVPGFISMVLSVFSSLFGLLAVVKIKKK